MVVIVVVIVIVIVIVTVTVIVIVIMIMMITTWLGNKIIINSSIINNFNCSYVK